MAVLKLSQITASGAAPASSDQVVGVSAGATDLLYTLSQIGQAAPSTIGITPISGGVSGNVLVNSGNRVAENTPTQFTAVLNVFTPTLKGLAPLSGGGTTNFLRADASFAQVTFTNLGGTILGGQIANSTITLPMLANQTTGTILGNNTGGASAPIALTSAQATAMLNLFTIALQGLAPASGGGTVNFLRADGTWAAPPSGALTVNTTTVSGGAAGNFLYTDGALLQASGGITWVGTGQQLNALGTITTNLKALNITGTWNAGGVTFDAPLFMNITNTASATGSLLADLQVGSSSVFSVDKGGLISAELLKVTTGSAFSVSAALIGIDAVRFIATGGGSSLYICSTGIAVDGNNSIAQVAATGSFAFSSSGFSTTGSSGDTAIYRQGAAGVLALARMGTLTSPATFQVYNTTDTAGGTPTNFERGVFDWTTTANTLTIGPQKGGTGSDRALAIIGSSASYTRTLSGGDIALYDSNTTHVGRTNGAVVIGDSSTGSSHIYISNALVALKSTSIYGWSASASDPANNGTADTGLSRAAAKVIQFNDGSADTNGWMQWGGQSRVTGDFSVTSSTVLINVTGLTVNVAAGRTYAFEAILQVTDAAAGGVQAAIAGTATATAIQYTGYTIADNAIKGKTNATALATAVASTTTTETTGILVFIYGTITVNAAGTLTVQMAQNTSNGTATIAKRGSSFIVYDMP